MSVKGLRELIYEHYYKQIGFTKVDLPKKAKKDLVIFAAKLMEKIRIS